MNKSIAVFKDVSIRDLFAEKLDMSIIDFTDVRFLSDKAAVIAEIGEEGCDVVVTDDAFAYDRQGAFVREVLEKNKNARIVVILKKDDAAKARLLFKLGVYDCIVKTELKSEYLYEVLLDRDYLSGGEGSIKARDEALRELFWGNGQMTENFSSIYRLNKDSVYVSVINLINYFEITHSTKIYYVELSNSIRKVMNEYFANYDNGEYFYNHYAQIILLFSPTATVDVEYVAAETKKVINTLRTTLKLRGFAVLDKEQYPFTELRSTWNDRLNYTKYYFLYDKNMAYIDDINEKFSEDFNAYERIKVFQQALNDFDKNAFDRETAKLLSIKPKVSDVNELTDFFLTLFNEIKKLEVQYEVAFADDHKFKTILRRGTIKQAVSYCQECVNKIMDGISESSRMSIHIKKYLENHIAENVTLKDLAINFNFEYNYSSKYFNKIMGMSFKKYFTNLRLEVAKNLLKTTKHKCYEIAAMCGYKNYEHFSRMFYKKYKIWPKQIK